MCERDRQTDKQIGDVCMGAAMSEVIGQLSESHFFPLTMSSESKTQVVRCISYFSVALIKYHDLGT